MEVEYFSSKIEFAMRGAGHVHGVIWCNLDKLDSDENVMDGKYRFPGIKKVFAKIRGNEIITEKEIEVLTRFVDAFTTCSLNEDEVGKNVARIAAQVNCHHHTFTCRKYCIKCRFGYPKYPIWRTIISIPRKEEKKKIDQYNETLDKVQTLLETPEVIEEIMNR